MTLTGKNIVLQAPTGAGKTHASLWPGLTGLSQSQDDLALLGDYPQRIVYSVPMRVLARSFVANYRKTAEQRYWRSEWFPSIQTGENPEDELFQRRVIFATVDQVLASFLNIPYGLPGKLDNINAGAMIGSYLIFDEFHLYPQKEMMLTVLAMLAMLKDISRFILMSATFSPVFLQKIAAVLEAEMIADLHGTPIQSGLFSDVTSVQTQRRTFYAEEGMLNAAAVKRCIQDSQRVLCVCNTVSRAQALYQALRGSSAFAECDIRLLHSRFYRKDRREIENFVIDRFNEKDSRPTIVVATQVIEVGLDISADVLLTECAPAASLIQRAGRCARRAHESGRVHVFQPHDKGEVNYAPYHEDGQAAICLKTWDALTSSSFHGHVIGFPEEQRLVDLAHSEADQQLVDGLEAAIEKRIDDIATCMRTREAGWSDALIRKQSSVPLYIDPDPNQSDKLTQKPWEREAIGLSKGQLHRFMQTYQDDADIAPFLLCAGIEIPHDDEAPGNKTRLLWQPLREASEVYQQWKFVAHPKAVTYSEELGLLLEPSLSAAKLSPDTPPRAWSRAPLHAERFHEHITGLYWAYSRPPGSDLKYTGLRDEALYPLRRLCDRFGKDAATGEKMLRVVLALHDVGKLNQPWQAWARGWQRLYSANGYQPTLNPDDAHPLAHTDFDADDRAQWALQQAFNRTQAPRGPHAGESAEACLSVLWDASGGDEFWTTVAANAIMRHHTPDVRTCGPFALTLNSESSLRIALSVCGFESEARDWIGNIAPAFKQQSVDFTDFVTLLQPSHNNYAAALMYLVFVRVLRLADQRSGHYWQQYCNISKLTEGSMEQHLD